MTTASLLQSSRTAHKAYRASAGRIDSEGKIIQSHDESLKRTAIQLALNSRLAAHLADPDHTDPEWANDPAPHADLVKFYEGYLAS